jgi:hypothetical protein
MHWFLNAFLKNEALNWSSKLWCSFSDIAEHPSWYEALDKKFRVPVPHNFKIEENTAKYEELAGKIRDFYFGTEPFSKDTWPKFADVCLKVASNVEPYYSFRMFTLLIQMFSLSFIVTSGSSVESLRLSESNWPYLQFPFISIVLRLKDNWACSVRSLNLIVCQVSSLHSRAKFKLQCTIDKSCVCRDFFTSGSVRIFHTEKYYLLGCDTVR